MKLVTVASLFVLLGTQSLAGQSTTTVLAGGGLSLPAGEFNSYANTGFDVAVAMERRFGSHPTAFRIGFGYAVNKDETAIGFHETTRLTSVFGSIVYHFVGSHPHIYGMVGVGIFRRSFSSDDPDDLPIAESRAAIQLGEGVQFRIRSLQLFAEARFITTLGTGPFQYFPIIIGVRLAANGS